MPDALSRILNSAVVRGTGGLVLLSLLAAGCGGRAGRPGVGEAGARTAQIPIALVLEREVKGTVYGRVIQSPTGVAVDRRDNILLVDTGNDRVIWLNSNLVPLRDIGGQGSHAGLFRGPEHVCTDEDQSVWVSDPGHRRLCRYSEQLEFIDEIDLVDEDEPLRFGHPAGVAVTDFGEVWVVDADNDRVAVLNNTGAIDQFVGDFGYPGGNLRDPAGIKAGGHDNLYVCDAGNGRVVEYDQNGGVIRVITHPDLIEPCAVAVDNHQMLWVLDRRTALVHCFEGEGRHLTTLGPMVTGADSPLRGPSDLALMSNGFVIISDTGRNRLLLCRPIFDAETVPEN